MQAMRLRTAMTAVAMLAILLGAGEALRRRARRLEALALRYGREANRLENRCVQTPGIAPDEAELLWDRVHWHDSVAKEYRSAAARPWMPFDPKPVEVTCDCGHHANRWPAPPL